MRAIDVLVLKQFLQHLESFPIWPGKELLEREGNNYICRSEFDSPDVDNEVLVSQKGVKLNTGDFYTVKIYAADDYDLYGEVVKLLNLIIPSS